MASRWQGVLGGSAVVGIGLVVELGSQFVRTVLLARLLGASEFGLVAAITTLTAIVEMVSFIGIDRYIVYSSRGGQRQALGVGHTLCWLRGILSALAVAALAVPTATVIGTPEYAGSIAFVAIAPLLRGAMHLGPTQMQRSGIFWRGAAADASGALLGLAVAAIAAFIAPDHRAVLWAVGAQAGGAMLLTHVLAGRIPYRLSLDREFMHEALRYGLPLVANGLALAAAFQLDRIVVGAWLGVAALGVYGFSMTLFLQPISLLGRLGMTALQPKLSSVWHADRYGAFPVLVRRLDRYCAALGSAGAAATACLGAPMLRLAFGRSFSTSDVFFIFMAGIVLLRLSRAAQGLLGHATGRTRDLMTATTVSSAAVPITIGAFYIQAGPEAAVLGVLIAELLSVIVADVLLRRHTGGTHWVVPAPLTGAGVLLAALGAWIVLVDPTLWERALATVVGLAGAALLLLL